MYLKNVERLVEELTHITDQDQDKRAFFLVAIDDKDKVDDEENVILAAAGRAQNIDGLMEVLLSAPAMAPHLQRAIVTILEESRGYSFMEILKELTK